MTKVHLVNVQDLGYEYCSLRNKILPQVLGNCVENLSSNTDGLWIPSFGMLDFPLRSLGSPPAAHRVFTTWAMVSQERSFKISLMLVSSPPLSWLTDETTHQPSRMFPCSEVMHCSWSDEWLHPGGLQPGSTVESSRTTAGQQHNSSWHLYHLHSGKNWIMKAAQWSDPFIPAAIPAENVCIKEHLTFFVRSDLWYHFKIAFCSIVSVQGSALSQRDGAGFNGRGWKTENWCKHI